MNRYKLTIDCSKLKPYDGEIIVGSFRHSGEDGHKLDIELLNLHLFNQRSENVTLEDLINVMPLRDDQNNDFHFFIKADDYQFNLAGYDCEDIYTRLIERKVELEIFNMEYNESPLYQRYTVLG